MKKLTFRSRKQVYQRTAWNFDIVFDNKPAVVSIWDDCGGGQEMSWVSGEESFTPEDQITIKELFEDCAAVCNNDIDGVWFGPFDGLSDEAEMLVLYREEKDLLKWDPF